jgi:hypothetical protein
MNHRYILAAENCYFGILSDKEEQQLDSLLICMGGGVYLYEQIRRTRDYSASYSRLWVKYICPGYQEKLMLALLDSEGELVEDYYPPGQTLGSLIARFKRLPFKVGKSNLVSSLHPYLKSEDQGEVLKQPPRLQHQVSFIIKNLCRGQHHLDSLNQIPPKVKSGLTSFGSINQLFDFDYLLDKLKRRRQTIISLLPTLRTLRDSRDPFCLWTAYGLSMILERVVTYGLSQGM